MASIAAMMRLLRLTDRENSTPSSQQVVMTFLVPNAESPRSMIVPRGLAGAGGGDGRLTWQAAARRSRPAAAQLRLGDHGGAVAVERVVICGDRPRRSSARLAILACPNEAPCLWWP